MGILLIYPKLYSSMYVRGTISEHQETEAIETLTDNSVSRGGKSLQSLLAYGILLGCS